MTVGGGGGSIQADVNDITVFKINCKTFVMFIT